MAQLIYFRALFLASALFASVTLAPVSIQDEAGNDVKDILDSQRRVELVTAFFQKNFPDQWSMVEFNNDCRVPSEGWERVVRCDNRKSLTPMTCSYHTKIGVSRPPTAVTETGIRGFGVNSFSPSSKSSISSSSYLSQLSDVQYAFGKNFGFSNVTKYDWTKMEASSWQEAVTERNSFQVPASTVVDLLQLVGRCGGYTVRTTSFQTNEYRAKDPAADTSSMNLATNDGKQRKVFFAVFDQANVGMAKASCRNVNGAFLASIRTDEEMAAVRRLYGAFFRTIRHSKIFAYIGAFQKQNGHFYWSADDTLASYGNSEPPANGGDVKTFWEPGQPDSTGVDKKQENCVGLGDSSNPPGILWHDIPCDGNHAAVCEFIF